MQFSPATLKMLVILCFTIWGGAMIGMKYAFESFLVFHVVFARVAFAGVFYLVLLGKWKNLPYQKGDWKYLVAMVAFEPCLFFLFETFSMKFTTASQGGVIAACFPLCASLAGWIFLKEKLSSRTVIAIFLAVIGVAISSYFAPGDKRASNPLLGNLLMLGAVLSTTGYAICARIITKRYSFLAVSAIQALGGTIVFFPLLFFAPVPTDITMPALAGLLYVAVGVGIIAYFLFNLSISFMPAGIVALYGNLIPVFTLLFAYILLGEKMNTLQIAGICIALAGIIISSVSKK